MNLGVGEAIVRVERSDYDFNLKTYDVPPVAPETASMRREKIIAFTRERYGRQSAARGKRETSNRNERNRKVLRSK